MKRLIISVILVLSLAVPAAAVDFSPVYSLTSYEPDEVNDVNVLPNLAFSPTLNCVWPVLGGVNNVPEATEGDYILRLDWTNEPDRKIEVGHYWSNSAFDLADVNYILIDVYFATESALPIPDNNNISIWSSWGAEPDWIKCESVPPKIGEWYTAGFHVGNLEYEDVNHIDAIAFEDMNGTSGTIYLDNLRLLRLPAGMDWPHFGRKIKFSGYWWSILERNYPIGAGPNRFTDDPDDVWVDCNGNLHLSVVKKGQSWYCSEVIANVNLGYGTYVFTVEDEIDSLDPNIVLGQFIYDVPDQQGNHREIDIELTRWGNPVDPDNAQFVVQPWYNAGNIHRFNIDYTGSTDTTTYEITWMKDRINFCSYYGDFPLLGVNNVIDCWSYTGEDIPEEGNENPRINFYLIGGKPPLYGQDAEIVIKSFKYISGLRAGINIEPDTLNLSSKGEWVTSYISLKDGYSVADINPASIRLGEEVIAVRMDVEEKEEIAIAKFKRLDVQQMLRQRGEFCNVEVTLSGELLDGTKFKGTDVIKVMDKGGNR